VLLLFILLWRTLARAWQRRAFKRQALRELARIRKINAPALLVSEVSLLLRRVALAVFPATHVAALYGEAWLQFLDHSGRTQEFTQGIGRCLGEARYQPQAPTLTAPEIARLLRCVTQWIRRQ
jgi:hypothetical protein